MASAGFANCWMNEQPMKLPIKARPKSLAIYDYTECEPFVENARAVLIHRVRYLSEHKISDRWPGHFAVQAWCGTSFTGHPKKFTFLDAPPEGKLLCERCEVAAFAANQPTAESIVGRHVHIGKVVAQQTCCLKGASNEA
jgi:hypothetical protein